jgi:penicillin-binding protein 1C
MRFFRVFAVVLTHGALGFLILACVGRLIVVSAPMPDLSRFENRSQVVTAENGEPLWGFLARDGRWRLLTQPSDVDPTYLKALIALEDHRFQYHPGVDMLALLRSGMELLIHRRVISGGSTLTMQAVRLLEPKPRTLLAKFDQILKALRIERRFTKNEILEIYLTLAPFGGNIDGLRAATLTYLAKEPRQLSPGEIATLVAIPQSPEERRLDRRSDAARRAKIRVVRTLVARDVIAHAAEELAQTDVPLTKYRPFTAAAPHFALRVRKSVDASEEIIPTVIDFDVQRSVELLVSRAIKQWDEAVNIAVVVLRNRDASFAAYVGGAEFGAQSRAGFLDLAQSERSPGSALKPFIYSVAFEKLIVRPDTIITDEPIEIDGYRPDNADGQFMGELTVRQALARSRNTTAVMLLKKIGVDEMLGRFRAAGSPLLLPAADPAGGLATGLGGEGVTLEQLTWFYTAFTRDGELNTLRFKSSDPIVTRGVLMSRYAARTTADVLADVPPPPGFQRLTALDGTRRVGFKTGTSYGFRDAWAIGFDELHTVGIWVGRPDGAAHLGAYGLTAAAPLLMQIFEALPTPTKGIPSSDTEMRPLGSDPILPQRLLRFEFSNTGARPHSVVFFYPKRGTSIETGTPTGASVQLKLTAEGGKGPYSWQLPGERQVVTEGPTLVWSFATRGQLDIRVSDSTGDSDETSFWLN